MYEYTCKLSTLLVVYVSITPYLSTRSVTPQFLSTCSHGSTNITKTVSVQVCKNTRVNLEKCARLEIYTNQLLSPYGPPSSIEADIQAHDLDLLAALYSHWYTGNICVFYIYLTL